jgi:hypothetical protein
MSELVLHWSRVHSFTVVKFSVCSRLKWMCNGKHEYVWVISWIFTRACPIVIIFKTNTTFWKLPAGKMYCLFWILWQWKSPYESWWYYWSKTIVKKIHMLQRDVCCTICVISNKIYWSLVLDLHCIFVLCQSNGMNISSCWARLSCSVLPCFITRKFHWCLVVVSALLICQLHFVLAHIGLML